MEGKARISGITVSSPNQKSGWSPILLWLRKQKLCSIGHLPRSQTVLKGLFLACVDGRGKGMWRVNTPDPSTYFTPGAHGYTDYPNGR
jgi:hypothetical protein